jgi:squalene-associated FAD-dependent desaturase
MSRRSMLVVGGGWAGIAAAVKATSSGWHVTMVEERPYLGGRARSFADKVTGDVIDNGQHVLMGCYSAMMSTLRAMGTDSLLHKQKALRVAFVDTSGRDVLDASQLPGKAGVALGLLRLSKLSRADLWPILRLAMAMQWGRATGHGLTCLELLQRYGQTERAIRRFWEPVVLATVNAPINMADASLLVTVMNRAFFGSGRDDSRIYIPADGLSALVEPFPSLLASHGGTVLCSTSVEHLSSDGTSVRATFSNGQDAVFDTAIVACQPPAVERLFPGLLPELVRTMEFSPIVSVYLWYDGAWCDVDFAATLGTTTQWVFNRRALGRTDPAIEKRFPGHVALTISAGSALVTRSQDDIVAACDAELRQLFPAMEGVRCLHGVVIKEKRATFLATPQVHPLRALVRGPFPNVEIVGDWTNTGLPATLEGAAYSGLKAVERLDRRE